MIDSSSIPAMRQGDPKAYSNAGENERQPFVPREHRILSRAAMRAWLAQPDGAGPRVFAAHPGGGYLRTRAEGWCCTPSSLSRHRHEAAAPGFGGSVGAPRAQPITVPDEPQNSANR
jgi:hypothetical protein